MDYIKTITSEAEVRENFVLTLRERKQTNQNALYLDSGAAMYYQIPTNGGRSHVSSLMEDYYPFLKKNALKKNLRTAFISMGCGNSSREKNSLLQALEDGYDITYFAVDSSVSALELSRKELHEVACEKQFLCADFGRSRFKEEIQDLTKDFDVRVYAFFGGTIGNLEPDYLADVMADLMEPGDYLWADVYVRLGDTPLDDRRIYERYRDYLDPEKHPHFRDLIFHPLDGLGIPEDSGNFYVEMSRREDLNSLQLTFKFQIHTKVANMYRKQKMTLLAGNEIVLLIINIFDPDGLVNFFEERDFVSVDKQIKGGGGQFMFRYQGVQ